MKQIIRENVFETNSSSMHSLVVAKQSRKYSADEEMFDYDPIYDDKFDLFKYEFDVTFDKSPFKVLSTPKDKLMYYISWYLGYKHDKKKESMIINFLSKHLNLPKNKINIKLDLDERPMYRFEHERKINWYEYYPCIYPNDTGEDVFECLEKHNVPFEEFIMSPKYTVNVDGDEYQEFKKLFDKNLIDINNIDYISSGIDFWDSSVQRWSMYYLNEMATGEWQYKEFNEDCSGKYLDNQIKKLVIEDLEGYQEDEKINQQSLNLLNDCLTILKQNRTTPLKIVLKLFTNKKEDYTTILENIDEVVMGK